MLKNSFVVFILICLVTVTCVHQRDPEQASIINMYPRDVFESKRVFDSTVWVKMSSGKEGLFGYINKLVFKNNKFYIGDYIVTKHVYTYSEDGEYLGRIGKVGKAPGEYVDFFDFEVDDQGNVSILDYVTEKIITYDKQGHVLKILKLNLPGHPVAFYRLSADKYVFYALKPEQGTGYQLYITDTNCVVLNKAVEYKKDGEYDRLSFGLFREAKDGVIYNLPPDNRVYRIDRKGNVKLLYTFDFAGKGLSEECKISEKKLEKCKKEKYIEYIRQVPLIGERYIFGLIGMGTERGFYCYDLAAGRVAIKKLNPRKYLVKEAIIPKEYYKDSILFSFLNYSGYKLAKDSALVPDDLVDYLKEGGYLILKNYLK